MVKSLVQCLGSVLSRCSTAPDTEQSVDHSALLPVALEHGTEAGSPGEVLGTLLPGPAAAVCHKLQRVHIRCPVPLPSSLTSLSHPYLGKVVYEFLLWPHWR